MMTTKEYQGGAHVTFNDAAWVSYQHEEPGLMHANVSLLDGRAIQCFVNRETGLVVVDVIDADESGGVEILRRAV